LLHHAAPGTLYSAGIGERAVVETVDGRPLYAVYTEGQYI
jgi:hypothetical protein